MLEEKYIPKVDKKNVKTNDAINADLNMVLKIWQKGAMHREEAWLYSRQKECSLNKLIPFAHGITCLLGWKAPKVENTTLLFQNASIYANL